MSGILDNGYVHNYRRPDTYVLCRGENLTYQMSEKYLTSGLIAGHKRCLLFGHILQTQHLSIVCLLGFNGALTAVCQNRHKEGQ